MAAAAVTSHIIPHTPYYKEHATNDYLSKTFESNVLHAPGDINRRTASQENYLRRRVCEPEQFKTPWGRKYSYGGMTVVQLPHNHRPKDEPPLRMTKGSQHYSSALCPEPRGISIQQFYGKSLLQKSHTRTNDELIPSPTKIDVSKENISVKFPQPTPYASHQSSRNTNIFPTIDNTDKKSPLSAETPAEGKGFGILEKGRGSYGRHEITRIPFNSEKKPMTWPGGPTYYKILKGSNRDIRTYYPVPENDNNPVKSYPSNQYPKTVEALKQLRQSQWQTCYQQDYNRDKPEFYMNLDNEDTSKKITALPNARIPRSLLVSGKTTNQTVEEITGEKDRSDCLVHFEKLHNSTEGEKENEEDLSSDADRSMKDSRSRTFPRPIIKQTRPMTTFQSSQNPTFDIPERLVKSAVTERTNMDVTTAQNWSRSDFIRKFNVKNRNEEETNLYSTTPEKTKRYKIPEAGYITTNIFS